MKVNPELKPLFIERMKALLGEKEFENYEKSLDSFGLNSIRANKLKISPEKLMERLEKKSWVVKQPFKKFPEIMVVESSLEPGEIGRSLEHLLGYYYVQDISSMLPVLSLNPNEGEIVMDLCAAPGSKTSQIAAEMKNTGVLVANDAVLGRIKILSSNLERCGVTNSIITKGNAEYLCKKLGLEGFKVKKILIDAPCSGEGTILTNKKTALMWNAKKIPSLSRIQKAILENAMNLLERGGEAVYSTCTHAPEENEEVVDYIIKKFPDIKVETPNIPEEMKFHHGVVEWQGKKYSKEVKKCARIYPQDNKTEGFFIAKLRKVK